MAPPDDIHAIKAKLQAERAKLLESLAGVSPETFLRPFDGGWSIKDILAHVAMAESVNVRFAQRMVEKDAPLQLAEFAGEYPDFPGSFELDRFNAWMAKRWGVVPLDRVLDALDAARQDTLAWLDTLTPAQLERRGEHAVWGDQTVRGMLRILVIHDHFHRADIEKRKQAAAAL